MLPFYFDTYEFGRTYCAIVCDQTVGSLAVYFFHRVCIFDKRTFVSLFPEFVGFCIY